MGVVGLPVDRIRAGHLQVGMESGQTTARLTLVSHGFRHILALVGDLFPDGLQQHVLLSGFPGQRLSLDLVWDVV